MVAASSRATATLSAGSSEQPRCASSSRVTPFMTVARGSCDLYTRCPKPNSRHGSFLSLARASALGMFSTLPMSMSMRRHASLAPPWAGPHSDDTPAAMQAKGLACEEPAVRTVLVEAFCFFFPFFLFVLVFHVLFEC